MTRKLRPLESAAMGIIQPSSPHEFDATWKYSIYGRILMELTMSRYRWNNLPDTVEERYIERVLIESGLGAFVQPPNIGVTMFLRASNVNITNSYGNPTELHLMGDNAIIQFKAKASECAPCWSNWTRTPDVDIIAYYASRLQEFDRTIDINHKALRMPFIVSVDQDTRNAAIEAFKAVLNGSPALINYDSGMGDTIAQKISVFNTGAKGEDVLQVQEARTRIWNECMTMLGVKSANTQKKERLITDEVNSVEEQLEVIRSSGLKSRQQAAERCNELFGTNISVQFAGERSGPDDGAHDFVA